MLFFQLKLLRHFCCRAINSNNSNLPEMIQIDIPGFKKLEIHHLMIDFNGTLGIDGMLLPGVGPRLDQLARMLEVHVVTANSYGNVRQQLDGINCSIVIIDSENQDLQKAEYLKCLGPEQTIAIGNGRNDKLMLRKAAIGIATLQGEGAAMEAIVMADLMVKDIHDALDLLLFRRRLVATLRM